MERRHLIILSIVAFFLGCAYPSVDFKAEGKKRSPLDDLSPLPISISESLANLSDSYRDELREGRIIDVPSGELIPAIYDGSGAGARADLVSHEIRLIRPDCIPINRCLAEYYIVISLETPERRQMISASGMGSEYGLDNSVKSAVQNAMIEVHKKTAFYLK